MQEKSHRLDGSIFSDRFSLQKCHLIWWEGRLGTGFGVTMTSSRGWSVLVTYSLGVTSKKASPLYHSSVWLVTRLNGYMLLWSQMWTGCPAIMIVFSLAHFAYWHLDPDWRFALQSGCVPVTYAFSLGTLTELVHAFPALNRPLRCLTHW